MLNRDPGLLVRGNRLGEGDGIASLEVTEITVRSTASRLNFSSGFAIGLKVIVVFPATV